MRNVLEQQAVITTGLVVQPADGGALVYDRRSDRAHWLDAAALAVFEACAHERPAVEGVSEAVRAEVLGRLIALDLVQLVEDPSVTDRRTMLRRSAKGVVAAASLPVIVSMVAPTAASADSSTCPAVQCSARDKNANNAKSDANSQCSSSPECRSASTCNCTPVSSQGNRFTCSGTCTF